jgi:hypothetical protein
MQSDGDGYVMMSGIGGTYDLHPGSARLITHGVVLAAGPTGYLAYECGDTPGCRAVVIDRKTGSRRVIGHLVVDDVYLERPGVITPDGATAAFTEMGTKGSNPDTRLVIVDLRTGANRQASVSMESTATATGGFGFSADGRQIAMAVDGGVGIVDVATGAVTTLTFPAQAVLFSALTTRTG